MDPENQEAKPDAALTVPEKRKRGRPRKDPSEKRAQKARLQAARMPPGFVQLRKNTTRVDPINEPTENLVGQIVTGVVEATFDAGYLLAVRIGNSKFTLRGAVFKPGHTTPVTPENDVAPDVEMIKRTEIPFPTELQPKRRRKRRSKDKNMQLVTYVGNGSDPVVTNASSKTNHLLAPSVSPVGGRGLTVPVVLQPINLSNGLSTNQPAPHLQAAQGKPMHSVLPLAVYPPNGSTNQPTESQTSSQFTVTPSENESAPFEHAEGVKPTKSNVVQDRVVKTESDVGDMNEPLFVEPLQTRHLVHHFQPPPGLGGLMHVGTGRMTELLQIWGCRPFRKILVTTRFVETTDIQEQVTLKLGRQDGCEVQIYTPEHLQSPLGVGVGPKCRSLHLVFNLQHNRTTSVRFHREHVVLKNVLLTLLKGRSSVCNVYN